MFDLLKSKVISKQRCCLSEQPVAVANTKSKERSRCAQRPLHLKLNVFAHGRTVLPKHCQGISVAASVIVHTYPNSHTLYHTHSGEPGQTVWVVVFAQTSALLRSRVSHHSKQRTLIRYHSYPHREVWCIMVSLWEVSAPINCIVCCYTKTFQVRELLV